MCIAVIRSRFGVNSCIVSSAVNRDLFTAWGFSEEDARKRADVGNLCVHSVVFEKKELGKFELNSQTRIISKPGTGATYSYDYVNRLRMTVDFTAIVRLHQLSSTPYWLFIHFKNGRQIRVATGRRDEIISVLRWMKDAGIPGVEWV